MVLRPKATNSAPTATRTHASTAATSMNTGGARHTTAPNAARA